MADTFDAFLVDLDGVVYVGMHALPGAVEALAEIDALGKAIAFITNDPFDSRKNYVARLRRLGIAASAESVHTSTTATATELARRHGTGARVLAIGSAALSEELVAARLAPVDIHASRPDAVVIGWHPNFAFAELRAATKAVLEGAPLYATNADPVFPMPDGPWPATGAILAAVETATGRRATVFGKPEPYLFARAAETLHGRIAVVGDRLDTDIVGGRRAGLATILVAPGGGPAGEPQPDYVVSGLLDLVQG